MLSDTWNLRWLLLYVSIDFSLKFPHLFTKQFIISQESVRTKPKPGRECAGPCAEHRIHTSHEISEAPAVGAPPGRGPHQQAGTLCSRPVSELFYPGQKAALKKNVKLLYIMKQIVGGKL